MITKFNATAARWTADQKAWLPGQYEAYQQDQARLSEIRSKGWIGNGYIVDNEFSAIYFSRTFATLAEAQQCVAALPKSLKARAYRVGVVSGDTEYFCADFSAQLKKNGVNKGLNETGIKRVLKAAQLLDIVWCEVCHNSINFEQITNFIATHSNLEVVPA